MCAVCKLSPAYRGQVKSRIRDKGVRLGIYCMKGLEQERGLKEGMLRVQLREE